MTQALETVPENEVAEEETAPHLVEVPLQVEAILGTLRMTLRAISSLKVGEVLQTSKAAGEPMDLRVNSVLLSAAEVFPRGEKLDLRVTDMYFQD
ncbi:MAG: FliM/FliN family flagellar motor C-terminal domain-containing protein [Acidobacteriota bacterium]